MMLFIEFQSQKLYYNQDGNVCEIMRMSAFELTECQNLRTLGEATRHRHRSQWYYLPLNQLIERNT